MDDKQFDNIIKGKLSEFKMDVTPDWDAFQETRFDSIVNSKLSEHSMASTPRWDLFLEKQKEIQVKQGDRAFDNTVRQSLANHHAPYNSSHWVQLKARLERIYAKRQALYTWKSIEILALFLLLINFAGRFTPEMFNPTPLVHEIISPAPVENNSEQNTSADNLQSEFVATPAELNVETIQESNSSSFVNNSSVTVSSNNNSVVVSTRNENTNYFNSATNKNIVAEAVDVNSSFDPTNSIDIPTVESNDNSGIGLSADKFLVVANISGLSVSAFDSQFAAPQLNLNLDNFADAPIEKIVDKAKASWLHLAVSFDNNYTTTPYNADFPSGREEGSEYYTESVGYSLSALYSMTFGKTEIETGLSFSKYSKDSELYDIYYQGPYSYTHDLNEVKYDIASVPFRYKRHFVQRTDFSLFATANLVPELILSSDYTGRKGFTTLPPTGQNLFPVPPMPEETISNFETNSDLSQGVLSGGSLDNSFLLRGGLGLGIQKNINANLGMYISGDYYFNLLNRVGPENDRINKYALSFGIKRKI